MFICLHLKRELLISNFSVRGWSEPVSLRHHRTFQSDQMALLQSPLPATATAGKRPSAPLMVHGAAGSPAKGGAACENTHLTLSNMLHI